MYTKSGNSLDRVKGNPRKDDPKANDSKPLEDKWNALKAYRKANDLCFTCGEKWGWGYTCPDKIPLNVVQELLEMCQLSATNDSGDSDNEIDPEDSILAVTDQSPQMTTSAQSKKRKTMRFQGFVGKQ